MGGQRLFWVLSFCLAMFCSGCRSSWQRHLAAGDAALHSGQLPRAQAHYARALKDAQAVAASLKGKIQALNSLAAIELAQGRPLPRKSTPAALLPRWEACPDCGAIALATALFNLASISATLGKADEAQGLYGRALTAAEKIPISTSWSFRRGWPSWASFSYRPAAATSRRRLHTTRRLIEGKKCWDRPTRR